MNKGLLAPLNQAERLLWDEAERPALALLDEDGTVDLLMRIRRARNRYTRQYRREASQRVGETSGRGAARPQNTKSAAGAEVIEEALSRVSRHLAGLSNQAAAELRAKRIAAARGGRSPALAAPRDNQRANEGERQRARALTGGPGHEIAAHRAHQGEHQCSGAASPGGSTTADDIVTPVGEVQDAWTVRESASLRLSLATGGARRRS